MDIRYTERGFAIADFKDRYGQKCSIQKSSLATEDAIWLGCSVDLEGKPSSRMHLTQEQVAELLPILQSFVETGDLE